MKKKTQKPENKETWCEYVSKIDPSEGCGMVLADWFSFDDGWNAPSDEPESLAPEQPEFGLKAQKCWWRKVDGVIERVRYSPYSLSLDCAAKAMPPGWVTECSRFGWKASNGDTDDALKVTMPRGPHDLEIIDRYRLAAKARLLDYRYRGVPTFSNIVWSLCPVVRTPNKRRDMLMHPKCKNQG